MKDELRARPGSGWLRIHRACIGRRYREPRIIDSRIRLARDAGETLQIAAAALGHDGPVLLITNQTDPMPAKLLDRYTRHMALGNQTAETIDFFDMDALSGAVPMRNNTQLKLTLMVSGLYRQLADHVGNGQQAARARTMLRFFIDATAIVPPPLSTSPRKPSASASCAAPTNRSSSRPASQPRRHRCNGPKAAS